MVGMMIVAVVAVEEVVVEVEAEVAAVVVVIAMVVVVVVRLGVVDGMAMAAARTCARPPPARATVAEPHPETAVEPLAAQATSKREDERKTH